MNGLLKTLRLILEIFIVLWVYVNLKRMNSFRWIYFVCLWVFALIVAIFPAMFIHVIFAGPNSLGNVLTLPWTFYLLYVPFTLIIYRLVDSIVNMVLIEMNEPEKTINRWRDVILGFLVIIAIAYYATGGISKMKEADEKYRRNVNGENLDFKT
jgi:hypothetical protein